MISKLVILMAHFIGSFGLLVLKDYLWICKHSKCEHIWYLNSHTVTCDHCKLKLDTWSDEWILLSYGTNNIVFRTDYTKENIRFEIY